MWNGKETAIKNVITTPVWVWVIVWCMRQTMKFDFIIVFIKLPGGLKVNYTIHILRIKTFNSFSKGRK